MSENLESVKAHPTNDVVKVWWIVTVANEKKSNIISIGRASESECECGAGMHAYRTYNWTIAAYKRTRNAC